MNREKMEFDVVIVGAGPAGLSAAIRLKQLAKTCDHDISVCIIEKGSEVGAHILSGCAFEPTALNELIPNWRNLDTPIKTAITEDAFYFLTKRHAIKLPTPPQMKNQGNYIISLGNFCKWLADYATNLGVEIFPGFAGKQLLISDDGKVFGIATGDMGIDKYGEKINNYQAGIELWAKQIMLAEGCRGSLTKQAMQIFELNAHNQSQTYGIGIKELWRVDKRKHKLGLAQHSLGWPLDHKTYGGSFIYHLEDEQVAVGFIVGLDYENPYINPYEEMQRFKTHPHFKDLFAGGERLCYGARALNEGGLQAIPTLGFPGGVIIGDSAGFLNVAKIKGTHTAMKSAMTASEVVFQAIKENRVAETLDYRSALNKTWVIPELYQARNIRPAFRKGLWAGMAYAAIDTYLLKGRTSWTFKTACDHLSLKEKSQCTPPVYPAPDGVITFDRLSSVYLSGTFHEENQPCHLKLADAAIPVDYNLKLFAAPEQRYCPAGVYEIVLNEQGIARLQINATNCIHCKTCDIKDPLQNITWVPAEGGGGPNYRGM